MTNEYLILYKPNVRIAFSSTFEEITGVLDSFGFKLSTSSGSLVYYGTAWISKLDEVAIHFYFNDIKKLDSILIQNKTYYDRNSLLNLINANKHG